MNGVTHYYYYDGINLVKEEWGDNILVFFYDVNGSPVGMQYRDLSDDEGSWDTYLYEKNLQGDIVAVYNTSGTKLVSYRYDAWGRILGTSYHNGGANTTAVHNPFRYRGYYYDDDLDLYYLATRYYDPVVRRFVTMDDYAVVTATPMGLTDKNLFAYCDNNPITRVDNGGEFWHIVAGVAIGAVGGAVSTLIGDLITGTWSSWETYLISAGTGALTGGLSAAGVPLGVMVAVSAGVSAAESVTNDLIENEKGEENHSVGAIVGHAFINAGFSALSTYIGGASNGKQMNKMYKASKEASGMFLVGGNHPNVKKELGRVIGKYYSQLGRGIGKGIKELGTITSPFAFMNTVTTTCFDGLFGG